jgi:uncharacterized protein (DUF2235 family)
MRGPTDHVILLDGTMSSLEMGRETNVGLIFRLLKSGPPGVRRALYYESGVQWQDWRDVAPVVSGRGINRQIRRAYGWLASHYRPGDRIFLIGFSRGAYAVRSLAGIIDNVGLLRREVATERNVRLAYRHYRERGVSEAQRAFSAALCHERVEIEMIGVFDTVKALGIRLPFVWMWTEPQNDFHHHHLSPLVRNGFHALALGETRAVYAPILWETGGEGGPGSGPGGGPAHVAQMWFRGTHGDVGGHLGGYEAARGLSNIPLVWMLENAERCGLALPDGWRDRFPTDPAAPSMGMWRGWAKLFLLRARRMVGMDPSEGVHPSALPRQRVPGPAVAGPGPDAVQAQQQQ